MWAVPACRDMSIIVLCLVVDCECAICLDQAQRAVVFARQVLLRPSPERWVSRRYCIASSSEKSVRELGRTLLVGLLFTHMHIWRPLVYVCSCLYVGITCV